MAPTAELRLVRRETKTPWEPYYALRFVLQQKWVQHHIPAGMTEAPFEWRDVPVVDEQETRNG